MMESRILAGLLSGFAIRSAGAIGALLIAGSIWHKGIAIYASLAAAFAGIN